MPAIFEPPVKIPWYLKGAIWFAEQTTGRMMLPARLLAWYPKAALASGLMEALVAHTDGLLDERILKLVRVTASFAAACPFCVDMNSFEYQRVGISDFELSVLQNQAEVESVATFTKREKLAVGYARLVSASPLAFPSAFFDELKANFSEREIVILAATAAQVNYWARLIQALGIPPAGFSDECKR